MQVIFYLCFFSLQKPMTLFDFNTQSDWIVVGDGRRLLRIFHLSPKGHGLFKGRVSLKNSGGFSSVRHRFAPK